jgi:hypothetical protein
MGSRVTIYVAGFVPKDAHVVPGSRPDDQSGIPPRNERGTEICGTEI